jgi:hypothetical protein
LLGSLPNASRRTADSEREWHTHDFIAVLQMRTRKVELAAR